VIGVSTLAAGHKVLVPELIEALRRQGGEDILVVVGGVVPAADRQGLKDKGVAAIYPPGTNIPEAAREILKLLRDRRKERAA
jgi:methylmalonyl-CoA mutase